MKEVTTHMKRYIIIIVCTVLILSCVGCFQAHSGVYNDVISIEEPTQSPVKPTPDVKGTEAPKSTAPETALPEPTPSEPITPEPEPTPTSGGLPLSGYVIGIDPGHQLHGNSDKEPSSPGSNEMKNKVTSGTQGVWTKTPEYEINLRVGLILKELLEQQGATVIMTRETNDVDISNVERAQLFNKKRTDYALRLHCNGSEDSSIHGAFMLVPSKNPYLEDCSRAAELLIREYCNETGAKNLGVVKRSDQTGFNWCERMIVNIEMGHMSNEAEDYNLSKPDYQAKMAQGLLNGILAYFK